MVQPFRQLFRETYFLTPAEEDIGDRSHRFSGHLVPNAMTYALTKGRGWSGTLGLTGFDGAGVGSRLYPGWGVRATVWQTDAGEQEFATIAEVFFEGIDGNEVRRMSLKGVPRVPFSEAMRDVDLIVSVASIGTDQMWLNGSGAAPPDRRTGPGSGRPMRRWQQLPHERGVRCYGR